MVGLCFTFCRKNCSIRGKKMHHEVKLCPQFFKDKKDGLRNWELRSLRERNFRVGDTVTFIEIVTEGSVGDFMPLNPVFGERFGPCEITYVFPVDRVLLSPVAEGWIIFTHSSILEDPLRTKKELEAAIRRLETSLFEVVSKIKIDANKQYGLTFDTRAGE